MGHLNMDPLPFDIVTEIFSYVSQPLDIMALHLTSKDMSELVYKCLPFILDPISSLGTELDKRYKKAKIVRSEIKCVMRGCNITILKGELLCSEHKGECSEDFLICHYTKDEEIFLAYTSKIVDKEGYWISWTKDEYGYMFCCELIECLETIEEMKKKGYNYVPFQNIEDHYIKSLVCTHVERLGETDIGLMCQNCLSLCKEHRASNPCWMSLNYCSCHKEDTDVKGKVSYLVKKEKKYRYEKGLSPLYGYEEADHYVFIDGEMKDFVVILMDETICCTGYKGKDKFIHPLSSSQEKIVEKHGLSISF